MINFMPLQQIQFYFYHHDNDESNIIKYRNTIAHIHVFKIAKSTEGTNNLCTYNLAHLVTVKQPNANK